MKLTSNGALWLRNALFGGLGILLVLSVPNGILGMGGWWGFVLIASGLIIFTDGFIHPDRKTSSWILLEGAVDFMSGLVLFTIPEINELFVLSVVFFWLLVFGAGLLIRNLQDMNAGDKKWVPIMFGIVHIMLAFVILNFDPELYHLLFPLIGFSMVFSAFVRLLKSSYE